MRTTLLILTTLVIFSAGTAAAADTAEAPTCRVATFSADVTIPLGHRCMGILPIRAQTIDDPLEAHGFVLLGPDQPIVLVAIDWCEIRNGAYDQWRDALAEAAGTTRKRVLVSSLHQHDAPVVDSGAQALLDEVGLEGELYDVEFHDDCVRRVADALRESLETARRVTHLGLGQARVEKVASSRRVVYPDGRVDYNRYSSSGGDPFHSTTPDGEIDPFLKTLSFWDGDTPVLALHSYATHPMSYYGKGGVSADFVGLARRRRRADDPAVHQIYVSGCSGDVTAGKYNDGTPPMRALLADRLYRGMVEAWQATRRVPLRQVNFRNASFDLPFHEGDEFTREAMTMVLKNPEAKVTDRILAAMGLSSRDRIDRGQQIDLPCVDFGDAQIVLFPGEAFVGYQLMAQQMRPESFVFSIGYGECWPGYVPTNVAFEEKFNHDWRWAGPGSEQRIHTALQSVLLPDEQVSEEKAAVRFEKRDGSLAIRIGGKEFATYVWHDEQIPRPHFRHVHSPSGIQVTRNHPPVKDTDLDDHPTYHPGVWMAFGDLSGADFWRNQARARHDGFTREPQSEDGRGAFAVRNAYEADGKVICTEECEIEVRARPAGHLLIWTSTFTSSTGDFSFGDQEEMGLGVRMATPLAVVRGGEITDSEGRRNEKEVWGKTADWCQYSGTIDGREAGVILMPGPQNFRPSWFHARDYGLLAANPFGRNAFTKGEKSNVVVSQGDELTLRFGLLFWDTPAGEPPDAGEAYRDFLTQLPDARR